MWLSTTRGTTNSNLRSSIVAGLLLLLVVSASASASGSGSASSSRKNENENENENKNKNSITHTHDHTSTIPTRNQSGTGPCATGDDPESLYATHPALCAMLDRIEDDLEGVAAELTDHASHQNWLVGDDLRWDRLEEEQQSHSHSKSQSQQPDPDQLPVVFAHGMGDSCFNSGMIGIGNHTADLLRGAYVVCIPTGDTKAEDTTNGYFLNMDKSVDVFAAKIAEDPQLRYGFHAVGFSQGNNVIRGYISRYNTPTVHTFVSVNGVNGGTGALPGCFPKNQYKNVNNVNENKPNNNEYIEIDSSPTVGGSICDLLLEQATRRAYTEFSQEHSFQSNYWRDPRQSKQEGYHKYSQLASWNNEGPDNHNQTLNENFAKTSKFVWVKATQDSMVWPNEGEHWGCADNSGGKDPFHSPVLPMNETEWYQNDLFGLKTAQEAGKNVFETFEGDHLRFTMEEFDRWVSTYLSSSKSESKTSLPKSQSVAVQ